MLKPRPSLSTKLTHRRNMGRVLANASSKATKTPAQPLIGNFTRKKLVCCASASTAPADPANPSGNPYNPLGFSFAEVLQRSKRKPAPLPSPPKFSTFTFVLPYLLRLASEERELFWRIGLAFICLLTSKAAGLMCPIMIREAVNSFAVYAAAPTAIAIQAATQAILLYGMCDCLKYISKELQGPLFTPVSQASARRVAYNTFAHVLGLDVQYHLQRRTGRLSRVLERGTRSIQMLYRAVIFTFVPTCIELAVVCGVLANTFSPVISALVLVTFVAYVMWSITMTQVAAEARKALNVLDNATSAKAVDALLNYETVALFNNQTLEVGQYHEHMKSYMQASLKTERLAALLNAGQAIILTCGLTGILVTALNLPNGGAVTAGDLVMIQGLLLQLWAPLQFLGWFYRELRSALVDMEEFFGVLQTSSHIKDGTEELPETMEAGVVSERAQARAARGGAEGNGVPSSSSSGREGAQGSLHAPLHRNGGSVNGAGIPFPSSADVTGMRPGAAGELPPAEYAHMVSANGTLPLDEEARVEGVGVRSKGRGPGPDKNGLGASAGSGYQGESGGAADVAAESARDAALWSSHWEQQLMQHRARLPGLHIALRDVQFNYSASRKILHGISLTMPPGSSTAFVGSSGSGKSTILKLLTRLYDVSSGEIKLNGVDIRDLKIDSLREAVSVVPQDTVLFNDTIMSNIRYGRPLASDDEVIAAARMAHLHEAVMDMPEQYSSVVGERGLKLSGGEKQRVAIARAFLRQPRLLICDEATSALDSSTEAQIMTSLSELAQGRTAVFVAHRLSTVRGCDQIVVLRGGKAVEVGSHEQLMRRGPGGAYYEMWQMQARETPVNPGEMMTMEEEDLGDEGARQGRAGTPGYA